MLKTSIGFAVAIAFAAGNRTPITITSVRPGNITFSVLPFPAVSGDGAGHAPVCAYHCIMGRYYYDRMWPTIFDDDRTQFAVYWGFKDSVDRDGYGLHFCESPTYR